jgi:hypothetical protein
MTVEKVISIFGRLFVAMLFLIAGCVLFLGSGMSANSSGKDCADSECLKALAAARAGTAKYHRYEAALEDGFVRVSPCIALPNGSTMGFHYMNFDRLQDGELNPGEPELLLYLPDRRGRMQLVAVEYALPGTADDPVPMMFGRPLHFSEARSAWELHAWIWQHNPDGMFEDFNPRLRCPAD